MRAIHRHWLVALIVLVASALSAPAATARAAAPPVVAGEVVVKLGRADDLPAVAGAFKLSDQPVEQIGSYPIYRLRITDGAAPAQRSTELLGDSRVSYAEPNAVSQAPEARSEVSWAIGGDAGGYAAQWAGNAIRLPAAQAVTRGAGVTVAVLDTGVDRAHPALAGRLLRGYDFVDMDDDASEVGVRGVDRAYGHGTHVAGLVALAAPDAKILPVRVLDKRGMGTIWGVAQGLLYAIDPDGNPATHDGADVINLSLSTAQRSRLLKDVLGAVTCAKGVATTADDLPCLVPGGLGAVIVAAAGNSAATTPEYPAGEGVGGTLAVGASTRTDALAPFSNRGSWVAVEAPGDRILSTVPGGGYGTWSGTSMAAPLTAGEAALVRAAFPTLTAAKIAQRIVSTAAPVSSAVPHRIDAAAAVGAGSPSTGGRGGRGR